MDPSKLITSNYLVPVFFASTAFVFLNFSLPIYSRSLGAGAFEIGGTYTVFTLTMLLIRPLVGHGLDKFGRRYFFSASFVFYALSMLVFQGVENLFDIYVARFLQGIGASLMWVSARTIVADTSRAVERGMQMGRLTARSVQGSMVGAFYGFTLLSMTADIAVAWHYAFIGYAVCAVIGFILSFRMKEVKPKGVETLSPLVISSDLKKFAVIVFLTGFASALIEPIYLIFLHDKFDLNIMLLAAAFFPAGIVYAILPPYAGRLSDRFGNANLIGLGLILSGLVAILLPWIPSIFLVALCYVGFAVGNALAGPAESALLSEFADAGNLGRLTGYKEAAFGMGAALGPLVGGAIYDYIDVELTFVTTGVMLFVTAFLVKYWLVTSQNPTTSQVPPTT